MWFISILVVIEFKNIFLVKEFVFDVFFVEVGVVEIVGEGKEVVGEIIVGGFVENLLLIRF